MNIAEITLLLYLSSKVFMFAIIPLWVWARKKKLTSNKLTKTN